MRIACLQFSPEIGKRDANVDRANAILEVASLEKLDLLVLPELAFAGGAAIFLKAVSLSAHSMILTTPSRLQPSFSRRDTSLPRADLPWSLYRVG